jgi:hypothetical protein
LDSAAQRRMKLDGYLAAAESPCASLITRLRLRTTTASKSQTLGHSYKVRERLCPHLSHYISAMDLDGDLAYADFVRDLLIHESIGHIAHDLALARAQ